MWDRDSNGNKALAFNIDMGEQIAESLGDALYDYLSDDEDDLDIDLDMKSVRLQINVWADGSWDVVGVGGFPIDKTKKLVDV